MKLDVEQFGFGVLLGACVALGSYVARFLNPTGAVATFFLAVLIFGVGGWQWTVPILVFFVFSSMLSKVGTSKKKEFESLYEKSDIRDHGQVLANGGVGGILALAQLMFPTLNLYPAYLGSVAAVTADTWGTEIGLLTRGSTISAVNLKPVPKGTNGGVSLLGFGGGVVGAAIIAFSSTPWYWNTRTFAWIVAAGVVASFVDSFLGAIVQGEYECVVCGSMTERKTHCNSSAKLVRGRIWITNDAINWACAFSGAILAGVAVPAS